ncbi:MAG TPA: selenocysteine-specific translation elongation factor [Terriglobales bacterium]|nr:selenocysteine-specific translation elongation factor [Terriglobales bacterium]
MKSIIVGTAGHIDHGKTALVKALTGIDADRLEEEKRRGITIDIGFAHLELPAPGGEILRLGFVDVPGHERFVRNMLAGIGGIDLVLLVIAADESIKPQTREHFDICRLLSVRRGITVLTKSDLVDRETLDVVRLEVEDFLRGSFLELAPIVPVSSRKGIGLDELKQALVQVASEVPARDSGAIARLPIDRVFTMKGFGTVITGTLVSGTIHKEEELEVFPTGRRVRVRGVQVHGKAAEQALAGQRTALNVAGASIDDLSRGMTLAPPNTFHPTNRVDVSLSLLPSAKPLKDRARVHFHAYTSETIAEVRLYEEKQVAPGQNAYAQLRMEGGTLLLPGDRFILRQFSPVITIGGGVALDAAPVQKATKEIVEPFLRILSAGDPQSILRTRIARRSAEGLSLSEAVAETGWPRQVIETCLTEPVRQGHVLRVGQILVHAPAIEALKLLINTTVEDFHKKNPLVAGISKRELNETVKVPGEVFSATLDSLVKEKKMEVVGELVRLPGRGVVMKDEEAESKKTIEEAFATAGLKVPALYQVISGLKVDKVRAQKIVTLLLRDKVLIKISDELVFHRSALDELRRQLAVQKAKSPKINVSDFKDLTGVSRKYAIPLLEYLDRERVTRRVGDERIIL